MKELIKKGIIFICLLWLILQGLTPIFLPKDNTRLAGMQQVSANGILSQKPHTIDTLVIGDSESYSSISPMQLWEEQGLTSYVCGSPLQTLFESYQYLQKALKNQKLKMVILETNALFRKYTLETEIYNQAMKYFPIFQYHKRWKTLQSNDLTSPINYTWDETLKGYRYDRKIKPSLSRKKHQDTKISKWNMSYLHKIMDLCQRQDITFMLLSVPSTQNWNEQRHNVLEQLSQNLQVPFLDLNVCDDLKIDWHQDTRDRGDHLNHSGAKKVSTYLGKYLSHYQMLSNHQDDPKYDKWHQDLQKYHKIVR